MQGFYFYFLFLDAIYSPFIFLFYEVIYSAVILCSFVRHLFYLVVYLRLIFVCHQIYLPYTLCSIKGSFSHFWLFLCSSLCFTLLLFVPFTPLFALSLYLLFFILHEKFLYIRATGASVVQVPTSFSND